MYRVTVKKFMDAEREVLANSFEELKEIVNLLSEDYADYDIEKVEKYDYDLAEDFIRELKEKNNPKDLVYGNDKTDTTKIETN